MTPPRQHPDDQLDDEQLADPLGESAAPIVSSELSADEFIEVLGRPGRRTLKSILIVGDAAALLLGFCSSLAIGGFITQQSLIRTATATCVYVALGLFCMRSQGLLLARISNVRAVEIARITRALGLLCAAMVVFDRVNHFGLYIRQIAVGGAASWLLLIISRSIFRTWVAERRQRGLNCRRVVVVGATEETGRLIELFAVHPELGIRVVGVIGDLFDTHTYAPTMRWLGDIDETEHFVLESGASGVLVSSDGLDPKRLNLLIRNLLRQGVHVHVATGISGIASKRVRSQALAHEPLLYIEPLRLGRAQHIVKRVFDIVLSAFTLLLASPVLLVVAAAIKLNDGGPVFFRQQRVGHNGEHFGLHKFRTMSVNAEKQLAQLAANNQRNGPLFKMVDDPRVTKIGKFLRLSSLDEIPQLFNVLRGQMSLVGPRPALPAEVEQFPAELRARENVMPGITGLWQVEARDNPSFEAYRRLDLFYVENWSITLDLIIILGTVEQFAHRLISALFMRGDKHVVSVAIDETPADTVSTRVA